MSQLLDLRDAMVAAISAALPPAFKVDGHLGRFTAADLGVFLTTAPAVKVAILGLADGEPNGAEGEMLDCRVAAAVYVVTKDEGGVKRDAAALAAVETLMRLVSGNRWGLDFVWPATPMAAQNLTAGEALAKGRALWAIEIGQPIRLAEPDAGQPCDPSLTLRQMFVGVAPNIGAAHEADYLGPIEAPAEADQ